MIADDAGGGASGSGALEPARLREGFVASLALTPSVFAYGSVFGGAGRPGRAPAGRGVAMTVLVFAGAAQFVAVPMIAAGASPLAVIVTTYVVNMRHYLMAATLAPAFRAFPRRWLALIAHVLNDESFAITVARSTPPNPRSTSAARSPSAAAFLGGMGIGTLLGGLVPEPERWGLDFAFPAVFLALVAAQLRRVGDWLVAGASAALAWSSRYLVPGNWHIVIAGLSVSVLGALAVTHLASRP